MINRNGKPRKSVQSLETRNCMWYVSLNVKHKIMPTHFIFQQQMSRQVSKQPIQRLALPPLGSLAFQCEQH